MERFELAEECYKERREACLITHAGGYRIMQIKGKYSWAKHLDFMVIDLGHHYSELPAINLLKSIIKKNFPKFAVLLSEADTSPIFYF